MTQSDLTARRAAPPMEVVCEMMKLQPERVKDYVDLHDNTWPELVKVLRKSGMVEEYVYILDNLVLIVMKCENFGATNAILEKDDVFKRWDDEVRPMLLSDEAFFHTKNVLLDLKPIWRLDGFDGNGILTSPSGKRMTGSDGGVSPRGKFAALE